MKPLVDRIRATMAGPRAGGRPVCLVCQRGFGSGEGAVRLRGGVVVHHDCALYHLPQQRGGHVSGRPPRVRRP